MAEFEITEEFATANKLTPEQVEAVKTHATGFYTTVLDAERETWGAKANENTQGILDGIVTSTQKRFKAELPRNKGEKHDEYLERLSTYILESKQSELEKLEADLQAKLKDFDGNKITKEELEKAQTALREFQTKYANYDEISEKASSVESLSQEVERLTKIVTFGKVKPQFPDTVDEYRAVAKWTEFEKEVEKDWDVKLIDEIPMAVNKQNPMNVVKLEDLVKKSAEITTLLQGRQQKGLNADPSKFEEIEGIPFKVPATANGAEIEKLITEHLEGQGLAFTSKAFSDEFGKLYSTILKQRTAKK